MRSTQENLRERMERILEGRTYDIKLDVIWNFQAAEVVQERMFRTLNTITERQVNGYLMKSKRSNPGA